MIYARCDQRRSGLCVGGPLDGKPMHRFDDGPKWMFKRDSRYVSHIMPTEGLSALPAGTEAGRYDFTDGLWKWTRPPS